MNLIQAFILGIVQGITEFLPVSSSGHLIVLPTIFNWPDHPLVFDTVLHLGTALAVLIYFWEDLVGLLKDKTKLTYVLVGMVPAGFTGFFFDDFLERVFRNAIWVVLFLILGSVLMLIGEKFAKKNEHQELDMQKSFKIGLYQCLALMPGFSRSGSTIAGGMIQGLNREKATKFSFLMSVPLVVAAAGFKVITSPIQLQTLSFGVLSIGFLSSFIVGLLSIRFLMSFVKKNSLNVFVYYRFFLALVLLGVLLI